MLSKNEQSRYSKQIILPEIGMAGQEKLRAAKVLVIGAGGLGCPILQYLTAAGVGTIGIADGDTVSISNLQRQVLYSEEEIGQLKADVAVGKLRKLNPHVQFKVYPQFIDTTNALEIIKEYDIVVDGSDNFATRYIVNDACVILDKPMVFGAIYKFEGQMSVFNYNDGPTYRCLFPEPPEADESPNCADIGVVATLPGIIGTIEANEAIKIITGIGEVLSGKLLVMDTLTMSTHFFNFKPMAANKQIKELREMATNCAVAIRHIDYEQLKTMQQEDKGLRLIDVREVEEHEISNIGGMNIPLSSFSSSYDMLEPEDTIVLYCGSGTRSNHAAKLLIEHGFTHVFNLEHGINRLSGL
jgi:sulfur-carrier protein adenylyltransferase/sulfurtransferase